MRSQEANAWSMEIFSPLGHIISEVDVKFGFGVGTVRKSPTGRYLSWTQLYTKLREINFKDALQGHFNERKALYLTVELVLSDYHF